jgi:hypothetical protein
MGICSPAQHEKQQPFGYLTLSLILLIFVAVSCISIQISSAMICRPMEIIFDLRFLSVLIVQVIGFIGCLLFAVKLGTTHAMEIRIQILEDRTILSPCHQCFLLDSK